MRHARNEHRIRARLRVAARSSALAGVLAALAAALPAVGAAASPCNVPAADSRDGGAGRDCVNAPLRGTGAASVRLEVAGGALIASGSVRDRDAARARLIVYRARGNRWAKAAERTAALGDGRFRARVAPYRGGRWKLEVVVPAAGGTVPAARRPAAEARFFETPPPGPLPGGAYLAAGGRTGGALVESLQARLRQAGFRVRRDGRFGRDDATAVRRFQGAHGLLVDGIVGRQTAAALDAYAGASGDAGEGRTPASLGDPPDGEVTPLEPDEQGLGNRTRRRRRAVNTIIIRRPTLARAQRLVFRSNRRPARFQCAVNFSAWRTCRSPWTVRRLTAGRHRLRVRAVDRRGRPDTTPAARRVRVRPAAAPAAVAQPAPAPTTAAPGTGATETRPVSSPPLTDEAAAALVKRSSFEPRPENATANRTVPTATELASFQAAGSINPYAKYVTGQFTGTTDEILQWAALKWGIDVEMARAAAVTESTWRQSYHGDIGNGESWGILQVKQSVHAGTHPLSANSTAFNADYWGAMMRYYYDGLATWLNDSCCASGTHYAAGDMWGAFGAWFSGRWHTASADDYIAKVKREMNDRRWLQSGF